MSNKELKGIMAGDDGCFRAALIKDIKGGREVSSLKTGSFCAIKSLTSASSSKDSNVDISFFIVFILLDISLFEGVINRQELGDGG